MPSILIKDLSPVAHQRLREQAKLHQRSMQKEVARVLNSFFGADPVPEFRTPFKLKGPALTTEQMVKDLKEGRR
jgi:plasmid stability protein